VPPFGVIPIPPRHHGLACPACVSVMEYTIPLQLGYGFSSLQQLFLLVVAGAWCNFLRRLLYARSDYSITGARVVARIVLLARIPH
jgi:hypothetical protein